ncbi:cytoplasmic protein [Hypsugopox virus]|nr:cytoplasmic protein [Hypsugopox virus]
MDVSVNNQRSSVLQTNKVNPTTDEINKYGQNLNLKKPTNYSNPPEIILKNNYPLIISCNK